MKTLVRQLLMVSGVFGLLASAWSSDLSGRWDLRIKDKDRRVVTTLVIAFTEERAKSCMGGEWKRVTVVSTSTTNPKFYPASEQLSYALDGNQLTIGRNEICDGYLWLKGPLGGEIVSGEYFSLGLGGGSSLGFFTLNRRK
jgi:hypothetical protein